MSKEKVLVWDKWNKTHIKKHAVTTSEVEQAYQSKTIKIESYNKRQIILGQTNKGRLLTIVVGFNNKDNLYVLSARDMSKKERRAYDEDKKE